MLTGRKINVDNSISAVDDQNPTYNLRPMTMRSVVLVVFGICVNIHIFVPMTDIKPSSSHSTIKNILWYACHLSVIFKLLQYEHYIYLNVDIASFKSEVGSFLSVVSSAHLFVIV